MNETVFKRALHNPPHLFAPNATYMLTASVYQKKPLMASPQRKREWIHSFQTAAAIHDWTIIAWVVLSDHYHAMVQSPDHGRTLPKFVGSFHKFTARQWNSEDNTRGRKVWWNYWDSCIRDDGDYRTRLRYIFWNPVKHELAAAPEEYEFSNFGEFPSKWGTEIDYNHTNEVNDVPEF